MNFDQDRENNITVLACFLLESATSQPECQTPKRKYTDLEFITLINTQHIIFFLSPSFCLHFAVRFLEFLIIIHFFLCYYRRSHANNNMNTHSLTAPLFN